MSAELLAELQINNEVVVINADGILVAGGLIENIEKKNKHSTEIIVSGLTFDLSGWSESKHVVLKKNEYEQRVQEAVIRKYSNVVDKKTAYVNRKLNAEQKLIILQKLTEIDELLDPILQDMEPNSTSYQFQQKMYGNEDLTVESITAAKIVEFYSSNSRKQNDLVEQLPTTKNK